MEKQNRLTSSGKITTAVGAGMGLFGAFAESALVTNFGINTGILGLGMMGVGILGPKARKKTKETTSSLFGALKAT